MYPLSKHPHPSTSRCTNGHNNLVQELDDAHKHCNCGDSTLFCVPTRAPVVARQQARPQPSKNCTCESPRSAAQCALCVPRSACSWNVHHSVEELNRKHEEPDELLELPLHDHRDVTNQGTQHLYPALGQRCTPLHFVGCSKSDFFLASISIRFLLTVLMKKTILGPISGVWCV